jgi:hypothetical protein
VLYFFLIGFDLDRGNQNLVLEVDPPWGIPRCHGISNMWPKGWLHSEA